MAAPSIILENITRAPREPLTIHLDHETYCAAAGDCRCTRQPASRVDYDPERKKRVVAVETKRFPEAITLNAPGTPGAQSKPLHPAVLKTADGAALLAARKIRSADTSEKPENRDAVGEKQAVPTSTG